MVDLPPPIVVQVDPDPARPPLSVKIGRNDDGTLNAEMQIGGITAWAAALVLLQLAIITLRQDGRPYLANAADFLIADFLPYLARHAASHEPD